MNAQPISQNKSTWPLTIGALGIVYGDIGTSPLYAFREAVARITHDGQLPPVREDILGLLSLILWTLTIIVTLKYVTILLRIDNRGEGGELALMAMARSITYRNTTFFLFLGMAGAAMFYGDSMITPAISVFSAVEGLSVITPAFDLYIIPITLFIIILLFLLQSSGTGRVSMFFGPIMTLWFLTLAVTGFQHIMDDPSVLLAINPYFALRFVFEHGTATFVVLGAVFLAVTGAEALYADLGHFGRSPIRLAWGWLVFPSLSLNYMGQAAMILKDPTAADNPFFKLVPEAGLIPLVILSGIATVIASQAVITGAYSVTRQAMNLGLLPRLQVKHTSDVHSGQTYLPQVNYLLMIGVILLVVMFRSSSALAATYGISVTGTMMVASIMAFFVVWQIWEWSLLKTILIIGPFLAIDVVFLASNLLKLGDGGWVPLLFAAIIMAIMGTWIRGTFIINGRARKRDPRLDRFMQNYKIDYPRLKRVEGSAFFLTGDPDRTPPSLMQNIRHNQVLHERNIILSVKIEPVPYVPEEERAVVSRLNEDFSLLVLHFGFMDMPDVQDELFKLNRQPDNGIDFDWEKTSLFLSRKVLKSHPRYGMPMWQDWIYVWLNKNAAEPTDFYKLPISRVIEIGRHVLI